MKPTPVVPWYHSPVQQATAPGVMHRRKVSKVTPVGILFPLFIVLLVPVRFLAGRFFTPEELAALDSEEEPEEEEMQWA